jgi:hypothetical protein
VPFRKWEGVLIGIEEGLRQAIVAQVMFSFQAQ